MKHTRHLFRTFAVSVTALLLSVISISCEKNIDISYSDEEEALPTVSSEDFCRLLSDLDLTPEVCMEVFDAVSASDANGYDQEYTLELLFKSPGYGVGEKLLTPSKAQAPKTYANPLKDLISDYYHSRAATKATDGLTRNDPEAFLLALEKSGMQIYWPYCEKWDGKTTPVITFDPGDESDTNIGYEIITVDGQRATREVIVDEQMALTRPVWVINSNDDSAHIPIELYLQLYGDLISGSATKTSDGNLQTLILRSMNALRPHDPWFKGASEYFIKMGAIDRFSASTESELKLYSPYVTDFIKVIKRSEVGEPQYCGTVMVSAWSKGLSSCAFLINEDDGGTQTSWKTEATVKIASKSYGVTLSIPINSHDDIIWRGSLSKDYLDAYAGETMHLGDMDVVFDFLEY